MKSELYVCVCVVHRSTKEVLRSITVIPPAPKSMDHPLVNLFRNLPHLSMYDSSGSDSASNEIEIMLETINMQYYKYK